MLSRFIVNFLILFFLLVFLSRFLSGKFTLPHTSKWLSRQIKTGLIFFIPIALYIIVYIFIRQVQPIYANWDYFLRDVIIGDLLLGVVAMLSFIVFTAIFEYREAEVKRSEFYEREILNRCRRPVFYTSFLGVAVLFVLMHLYRNDVLPRPENTLDNIFSMANMSIAMITLGISWGGMIYEHTSVYMKPNEGRAKG